MARRAWWARWGGEAHLDVISLDYRDPRAVEGLRARLAASLRPPASCQCHTIPDRGVVHLGGPTLPTWDEVEREACGLRRLHRERCTVCGTSWLVAAEERVHDLRLVSRQAAADWPEVRTYRGLLASASGTGVRVQYGDPLRSTELHMAMLELASEAPGIALSDIVELLPVDRSVARRIARDVMIEHGARIDLER